MVGTCSGSISGTDSGITFTLSFSFSAADAPTAQTTVTGIKNFLITGGATINSVSANFTPQSTAMS